MIDASIKKRIETAISKTGFLLEKYISDILENDGWSVINNRYYIDSITNTPRELDILAYKRRRYEDILHIITLLISCKKSENHDWVFLTKPIRNRDIDLIPMTIYTNSEIIEATDYRKQLRDLIQDKFECDSPFFEIFGIENNVFAIQEIEKDKPQNEKAIYSSFDSLLKAANFEMKSLPTRKTKTVLYTFNLITVFEGSMYEVNSENDTLDTNEVENIKYINRFIINNNESFYRLQFCKKEYFTELLKCYDQYFNAEHTLFRSVIDDYYTNCLENEKYLHAFKRKIDPEIKSIVKFHLKDIEKQPPLDYWYRNTDNTMGISLPYGKYTDDEIKSLNTKEWLINAISRIFHRYFRYQGTVEFTEEILF
jgi:hypothetical protein